MYKHQTNSLSQTFSDYFIKHSQIHNYPTGNAQDYGIYKAKKVFADQAIQITWPTLWNSLDSKLKHCKLLSTLETNLNQILLIIMISLILVVFGMTLFCACWFCFCIHGLFLCSLGSQGMAHSDHFWPFVISSIPFCLFFAVNIVCNDILCNDIEINSLNP